jgi:adenylosuccinate synthase
VTSLSDHVTVVVGAQWGDEGKGKWIDVLAKSRDIIVRFQGGNNAGHTLWIDGVKFVLHQIPSGLFQPGSISAMASGVVVHPVSLVAEIEKLKPVVKVDPINLWISMRAHVISPWHIYLDGAREAKAEQAIGTTKRGIGPTYSDKAQRSGIRIGSYVQEGLRSSWFKTMMASEPEFKKHYDSHREEWDAFEKAASLLAPFVCDVETKLRSSIAAGKKVLLEGAQGTLLDIDHGTYPFVTSSSTIAAGACTSLGLSPKAITQIIGIGKAYVTRVGEGPCPTELFDETGALIAKKGHEFGATTGRPRRCGWFDAVAFRYSAAINGFDGVIINKIDILTGIEELKICTKYRHPTLGELEDFPCDYEVIKHCTPIYETYKGWVKELPKSGSMADLDPNALTFLQGIERHTRTKIMFVGTGPGREEYLAGAKLN